MKAKRSIKLTNASKANKGIEIRVYSKCSDVKN